MLDLARVAPRMLYPAVVSGAFVAYALLCGLGLPAPAAAYAAAALRAAAVIGLEQLRPERATWRPARSEVRTDATHLVLVQLALPTFLAATLGAATSEIANRLGLGVDARWPHTWPVPLQVALMLLAADFLRYWLHVAAHRFAPLWRLHAVHHSPGKLYSLNVARFHPLEKTLQYLLDTLPFAVLGVSGEVLASYLVFYAINGFFQHSNVAIRLGLLNYLVSGPELHRWHHSRIPSESNSNYGNNLIVWDLLFGTRRLPVDREVDELGLPNRRYPRRFAEQLRAPFVRDLERVERPMPRCTDLFMCLLMRARMTLTRWTHWRRLMRAADRPRETQLALLRRILEHNAPSRFGREHDFEAIRGYEDFKARVPVQSYETLRPYVDAHERTGEAALTIDPPLLYAQTSGTTGEPKYIPVPAGALREHERVQMLFAYSVYRELPDAYAGRILAIVSPAVEGHRRSGIPFGSTSGQIYRAMPALARSRYVVPPEVFDLEDCELKYRLIVRLAVVRNDVTAIGCANPSTLLKLLDVLREQRATLMAELEQGGFTRCTELPAAVRRAVAGRLACAPERLRELRAILARPKPAFADLWPGLRVVSTWTGGSCGMALSSVRSALPARTRVVELGYLSSEFRGSLPVDIERGLCLPTLDCNFFEFVEKAGWESGDPEFLTLDHIDEGHEYYVIVTTGSGLYRYFMNDIVRVTGRFRGTPTLEFVQKGKGVTNITGEKLYEGQLIEAVRGAERELGFSARFFLALADPKRARYRLLLETLGTAPPVRVIAEAVERNLCQLNLEYAQKRSSRRLGELEVRLLREGTGGAYKSHCVARGQREGQFKFLALQYADAVDFDYGPYCCERGEQAAA